MALNVFSPSGCESEDFTQFDVCVSGTLQGPVGFCGSLSMMTMCVRPRHNDAFILPESLSSVFSGILRDSRLESPLFSKLAITCPKHVNFRASFQNIIHLIHSEFNDIIWSRLGVFITGKCLALRAPLFVGGDHRQWVAGPKTHTHTHTFITAWPIEGSLGYDDTSKAAWRGL